MNFDFANRLLAEIEQTITRLFRDFHRDYLICHNLEHTRGIVKHATGIATAYPLSGEQHFILLAAAWFHDTGQLFTPQELHEEEGVKITNHFFAQYRDIQGPKLIALSANVSWQHACHKSPIT